jgi:hypothetical protein
MIYLISAILLLLFAYVFIKNKVFYVINIFSVFFLILYLAIQNTLEDRYNDAFKDGQMIADVFYSYLGLQQIAFLTAVLAICTFFFSLTYLLVHKNTK